jgi:hypothetical protein
MKEMPIKLREYMADNLRSNYTGGFIEYQFDKSVDWVQSTVRFDFFFLLKNLFHYLIKVRMLWSHF